MMDHHSSIMNPCGGSSSNNCVPPPPSHGGFKPSFITFPNNNNINYSKQKAPNIPLIHRGQPVDHGRDGGIVPMILPQPPPEPKPKRVYWTDYEHSLFIEGLKKHGKGNWKKISEEFLPWKTRIQICGHARTYFQKKEREIIPSPPPSLPPDWDLIHWDWDVANQQQQQVAQPLRGLNASISNNSLSSQQQIMEGCGISDINNTVDSHQLMMMNNNYCNSSSLPPPPLAPNSDFLLLEDFLNDADNSPNFFDDVDLLLPATDENGDLAKDMDFTGCM
ncbi:hypothetical protein RIF29_29142 [Crotalaria pallida]|uniref:Uncharacterized protein n=1 Tax=Crotalaria pallida TaxID=3830 RepID=A0AAN9EKR1_CROPI